MQASVKLQLFIFLQEDSYCDKCRLKAAKEIFQRPEVFNTIGRIDRGFWACLPRTVITEEMQQEIQHQSSNNAALGKIRTVCFNNEYLFKMEISIWLKQFKNDCSIECFYTF